MRYLSMMLFFGFSMSIWINSSLAKEIDQTLAAQQDGEITIDIVSGSVRVVGWDKSEVNVTGELSDGKGDFIFKVNGAQTLIELESKNSFWNSSNRSVRLKVHVPQNSSITAEGASTEFVIENILGAVNAASMSGDVTLEGGNGNIELEAVSGDITVRDATGRLNLSSVSGDVAVQANANYFEAQTVSGDIDVSIGSADKIDLESVSGDINLSLLLADKARLEAGTVSGDIDIDFQNDDINARFDIETGPGGRLKNKLSRDGMDKKNRFSNAVDFKLGEGDGSVEIETMSGTIGLEQ